MGKTESKEILSPSPPTPLTKPWRNIPELNSESLSMLKRKIENYRLPSNLNATKARILMLGPIGAGKSSFVNTINSIFKDRMTQEAIAGGDKGSLTMMYRVHKVRSATNQELNFNLCDTCGMEKTGRPDLADLNYLLEGNVPEKYDFSTSPIHPGIPNFISQPELHHKIHCVAFVIPADSAKCITEDIWNKIKDLKSRMNKRGIPSAVLLTKIDKITDFHDQDVSKVFFDNDVQRQVKYIAEKLQIPAGTVMPIKNYESEGFLENSISCLALQALDQMLGYAIDFLQSQHDLKKPSDEQQH